MANRGGRTSVRFIPAADIYLDSPLRVMRVVLHIALESHKDHASFAPCPLAKRLLGSVIESSVCSPALRRCRGSKPLLRPDDSQLPGSALIVQLGSTSQGSFERVRHEPPWSVEGRSQAIANDV
jgi:hypothetical protein